MVLVGYILKYMYIKIIYACNYNLFKIGFEFEEE